MFGSKVRAARVHERKMYSSLTFDAPPARVVPISRRGRRAACINAHGPVKVEIGRTPGGTRSAAGRCRSVSGVRGGPVARVDSACRGDPFPGRRKCRRDAGSGDRPTGHAPFFEPVVYARFPQRSFFPRDTRSRVVSVRARARICQPSSGRTLCNILRTVVCMPKNRGKERK